jgi:hypothetical protein
MPSVTGNMVDDCTVLQTAEAACTAACCDCQGNWDDTDEMHLFWKKMKRKTTVYRSSGNLLISKMLRVSQYRVGSFYKPPGWLGLSMQNPTFIHLFWALALDLCMFNEMKFIRNSSEKW